MLSTFSTEGKRRNMATLRSTSSSDCAMSSPVRTDRRVLAKIFSAQITDSFRSDCRRKRLKSVPIFPRAKSERTTKIGTRHQGSPGIAI